MPGCRKGVRKDPKRAKGRAFAHQYKYPTEGDGNQGQTNRHPKGDQGQKHGNASIPYLNISHDVGPRFLLGLCVGRRKVSYGPLGGHVIFGGWGIIPVAGEIAGQLVKHNERE
mgnify:CR=1 FL=1